jgi:hypothetical protein
MSQPLVTFEAGKLTLCDHDLPLTDTLRVVSVVGKGRRGKSTFLNSIISHLISEDVSPFQTSDGDEHCTKSIDAYVLPELNLLLLDSRGLDYEDSRNDPALLLFIHQISDLVIFNDRQRLDNSALKLLEPICAFTNYLPEEMRKPKLYFRIADCEIKETSKAIGMLLASYPDQYQSIRDSVRHLFDSDIRLIRTELLDKKARASLDEGHYLKVINDGDYGFAEAIGEILNSLPEPVDTRAFLDRLAKITADINGNEDIVIEKLDVVKLQAREDMNTWEKKSVSPTLFTDIDVDGTQASFEANVEPRKNQKKATLSAFTTRFKAVAKEIRDPYYRDLADRLAIPIHKAIEESKEKALALVKRQQQDATRDQTFPTFNNFTNSFTTLPPTYLKRYFASLETYRAALQDKYVAVKEEGEGWIDRQMKVAEDCMAALIADETEQSAQIQGICSRCAETFQENFVETIGACESLDLTKSNSKILEEYRDGTLEVVLSEIVPIIKCRSVFFQMSSRKLKGVYNEMGSPEKSAIAEYDLVKVPMSSLKSYLTELITRHERVNDFLPRLVSVKKSLMFGKIYADTAVTQVILRENPAVRFVTDDLANRLFLPYATLGTTDGKYYMTKETWDSKIQILYGQAAEKIVLKGCAKSIGDLLDLFVLNDSYSPTGLPHVSEFRARPLTQKLHVSLQYMWNRQLSKVFCRMSVEGHIMPVLEEVESCHTVKSVTRQIPKNYGTLHLTTPMSKPVGRR